MNADKYAGFELLGAHGILKELRRDAAMFIEPLERRTSGPFLSFESWKRALRMCSIIQLIRTIPFSKPNKPKKKKMPEASKK